MSNLIEMASNILKRFKKDSYAFGNCVLDDSVGKYAARLGKKAMFVGRFTSPWFDPIKRRIISSLEQSNVTIVDMAKSVPPNAPVADVYRLHSHIVHKKPELIVVADAGSGIDAVKAAAMLATLGDFEPELDPFYGVGEVTKVCQKTGRSIIPVLAVMMAASSAAHLTKYSNITDPTTGQKKLIVDEAIVPPYSVFDYEVTATQPMNLTLDGGLDGISHLLEVYFGSPAEMRPQIEEIAELGIEAIIKGLTQIALDDRDSEARTLLGIGTDLGGYAIMIGGTSGAHLNSFSLVDVLSHGRACALMNPFYTVFFAPAIEDQLRVIGRVYKKFGYIDENPDLLAGRDLGIAVARGMLNLSEHIHFPKRLKDIPGITRDHIDRCLGAAKNPQLEMKLKNMPVPLNAALVDTYMRPILEAAWEGDLELVKNM